VDRARVSRNRTALFTQKHQPMSPVSAMVSADLFPDISTHLNFFRGFEYDPTPEAEAMMSEMGGGGRLRWSKSNARQDRMLVNKDTKNGYAMAKSNQSNSVSISPLLSVKAWIWGNTSVVHRPGAVNPLRPASPNPPPPQSFSFLIAFSHVCEAYSFLHLQVDRGCHVSPVPLWSLHDRLPRGRSVYVSKPPIPTAIPSP
jgi:hypothetical protein